MPRRLDTSALTPLALLAALAVLVGCATPVELVTPPSRKADVYPTAKRSGDLVVAIDTVRESRRAQKYFGFDMREHGLMPAQIIVSNHGDEAIEVGPADILVSKGRSVIDPVPAAHVASLCKAHSNLYDGEPAELIDAHFASMSFPEMTVAPGETVRGWMFFDLGLDEKAKKPESPWFRVVSLDGGGSNVGLRMAVTESESGQRLHFGPYRLDR